MSDVTATHCKHCKHCDVLSQLHSTLISDATATHCNILSRFCTATHCNTLQHTATHCNLWYQLGSGRNSKCHICCAQPVLFHAAQHCNQMLHTTQRDTLQHTVTHTATHSNAPLHSSTDSRMTLYYSSTLTFEQTKLRATLQLIATHCNSLQRTATKTLHETGTHCLCSTLQFR